MLKRIPLMLVVLALALAACSSSNTGSAGGKDSVNDGNCDVATVTGDKGKKPEVKLVAGCEAPTELVKKDLIEGSGAEAKSGNTVTVHYIGLGLKTKKEFDASWGKGQPFPVVLGSGGVIQGWEQGLVGVKAGGRRMLVIPPSLGYGAQGYPPVIEANETLVFVIDVLEVK